MSKINIISRLMASVQLVGNNTDIMENQVKRIRQRLIAGRDVEDKLFAPYKDKNVKHKNSRPLQRAVRLFDEVDFEHSRGIGGGVDFHAQITGRAAKIAAFQNIKRNFAGFSRTDMSEARQDFRNAILEGMKNVPK